MKTLRKLFSLCIVSTLLTLSAHALSVADFTDVMPKVDEAPVPVKTHAPVYPQDLRREGVAGMVSIVIVISETGDVLAAEVGKSTNSKFDQAALDAVKTWKFKPAKLADKAVKVRVTVPVRFSNES